MSVERVKDFFEKEGIADRIQEFDVSSATVELAAQALTATDAGCQDTFFPCGRQSGSDRGGGRRKDRQP